jgi:hypothetical protein
MLIIIAFENFNTNYFSQVTPFSFEAVYGVHVITDERISWLRQSFTDLYI